MPRFQDISIKRKLTVITVVASTVALLLVSAGFIIYELSTYRQMLRRDLSTLAEVIGNQSTAALSYDDAEAAEEILAALRAKKHITAAALYKQGQLLAQYPQQVLAPGLVPAWPEPEGARFERDQFVLSHQVVLRGEPLGTVYLRSDLQEIHDRLKRSGVMVGLFLLASVVVTYGLSSRLQRIISRPIFHLAATARAVSERKNYSLRAARHGNDELGQLIDGFNLMLEQIQQRDGALQEAHDKLEKRVHERTKDLLAEINERRRAESALQQQLARTNLLNRITQVISERQDLASILHVVLRELQEHFDLELGTVALLDEASRQLRVAAVRAKNPLLTARVELHEGLALAFEDGRFRACREGQTVYVADTRAGGGALAGKLARAGLGCAAAVPLLVEKKLFGVLLCARTQADGFSSGECEFLRMLSEHLALAAHQARLYSELERAYNELRQTQQAVMQQERLKALGQMASGIAHDINNALSPVIGFTDLLLKGENRLSGSGRKYLQYIGTAGKDIAHIVARLREFYRRRDDNKPVAKINLNSLAEQVVDMTRPRWRDIPQSHGTTVEVQLDLEPDLPVLAGIESELREALTNLLLNAVDALPRGGRITVRTRLSQPDLGQGDGSLPSYQVLEVSDTGIGMTEEIRKHCLEPFYSTKGKRGTGLGLAMVYGIMERHDGKIEIDSKVGEGTTFRLIFPQRQEVLPGETAEEGPGIPEPRRILYIDDEPLLRELLKQMLQLDGHSVEVSDSGQAGLEAFRSAREQSEPFDVVITDLGMPYLDGRQVAAQIKRESPRTPVVILTGWGALMQENGVAAARVDAVLSKPPRFKELREVLLRLCSSQPSDLEPESSALAVR